MKVFVGLIPLIVAVNAVTLKEANEKWSDFKITHLKTYHPKEEQLRFNIFQDNLHKIEEHNARYENGEVSYFLKVTKFADLTPKEFLAMLNSQISTKPNVTSTSHFVVDPTADVPDSIDWREKGAVSEVKDQGSCGADWAFSATGSIEGQLAIKNGKVQSLSEQLLIDCSYDNNGCLGGLAQLAFQFVETSGICLEDNYPYTNQRRSCKTCDIFTKLTGFANVNPNETDLKAAVGTIGPISVELNADNDWQFYGGGIFSLLPCNVGSVNHGALAVGYNHDGKDYWIIKNSWGKNWGEEGYIRLLRGSNECFIGNVASYPLL